MKKIGVAVIGAGYWGKKHVDEYSKMSSVDIKMVCDKVQDNLKFCKENYGIKDVSTDYRDVIKRKDIDAVSVCTPNETHYQICKDMINAGKHVLVEKPMTLSSKEAHELVELAKKKNVILFVGHIFRFNNALDKIRKLIRENFFGKIFLMKLKWTNYNPPFPNRDVIFDLAPHMFDIINYLTDRWPKTVFCMAKPYRRERLEEAAYILCEMGDNTIANIEINWLESPKKREITIIGMNRSAKINAVSQEIKIYESGYEYDLDVDRNNTIRSELIHFVNAINSVDKKHINSGEIGAKTIELIELCKKSIQERRIIDVGK